MNTSHLLRPQAILISLVAGACLLLLSAHLDKTLFFYKIQDPSPPETPENLMALSVASAPIDINWSPSSAETEPAGCIYDRSTFNAIRHQARLAHQDGRHDRATVLNFAAELLRCRPEELERELAQAMSEVWEDTR